MHSLRIKHMTFVLLAQYSTVSASYSSCFLKHEIYQAIMYKQTTINKEAMN